MNSRIRRGEARFVVGARSAIFAPLDSINLLIIDEEQEATYKSDTTTRYHAAEIARIRAWQHRAVLVLGSATPSVETYYRSRSGRSTLLELPERVGKAGMAEIEIVDMRLELAAGNKGVFSLRLKEQLEATLAKGEQAMLFINRRGLTSFVLCRDCGYICACRDCDVNLTEHINPHARYDLQSRQLICHYCGRIELMPEQCPECGSRAIGRFGVGTQSRTGFSRAVSRLSGVADGF